MFWVILGGIGILLLVWLIIACPTAAAEIGEAMGDMIESIGDD